MSDFNYKRRVSSEVKIGGVPLGAKHPIRIQSMTSTNTNDIDSSVEQVMQLANGGAAYVRLTAQGVREAESLLKIKNIIREKGYVVPLVADIHFNPRAAEAAAKNIEKVRINPGNFVDKIKTFSELSYTDEEYEQELVKIEGKLVPLLDLCKQHNTALRLGINHGSLSDRIMSKYGDTPQGMVESCMEFLRICVEHNFKDIVISMKTSNTIVMNEAIKLLVQTMDAEGLKFPLHLGVTEAGDGEDGRIKSAVGIGALLADGYGDTIRVSLSEDPIMELPVASAIVNYITQREGHTKINGKRNLQHDPFKKGRRQSLAVENIGGENQPIVISDRSNGDIKFDVHFLPDYIYVGDKLDSKMNQSIPIIIDVESWQKKKNMFPLATKDKLVLLKGASAAVKFLLLSYNQIDHEIVEVLQKYKNIVIIAESNHQNPIGELKAFMHKLLNAEVNNPVVFKRNYEESKLDTLQIKSAIDLGAVLLDGFGDGVTIHNGQKIPSSEIDKTLFTILQASRLRTSKTEYISCPSCGRTLFDLQSTVALIKKHTSHLTHLKIGIMGCIVNGPGEMADADYGYVGSEKGKVSLYKKKNCVKKNIPSEDAVEELITLIKINDDWVEPTE